MIIEKITKIGERSNNQDSLMSFVEEKLHICAIAVADGVGSYEESDICSQFVTAFLEKFINDEKETIKGMLLEDLEILLYNKVKEVHNRLLYIAKEKGIKYGTTLTLCLIVENTFIVVQVGDSRCYIYQNAVLRQITKDQTLKERKNVLLQALGHSQIEPMLYDGVLEGQYEILLCTDGLTNELEPGDIRKVLKAGYSEKEKLETLADMASRAGEKDNISAIIIKNNGGW